MVRQRSRTGQGKTKRSLSRKDSSGSVSEQLPGRDEGKCRNLVLSVCSCLMQEKQYSSSTCMFVMMALGIQLKIPIPA